MHGVEPETVPALGFSSRKENVSANRCKNLYMFWIVCMRKFDAERTLRVVGGGVR
jgi:hypothetical protein